MQYPLLGIVMLSFAACSTPSHSDAIRIGEYASLSGAEATFGRSVHRGTLLAVQQRNAAGGIHGHPIALISYDDRGTTQEAGNAVVRLITHDQVVALIGEISSSLSLAGGRVAQQYRVPMLSPGATNPQVTRIGDMIARACFTDDFQGYVMAQFARTTLHITQVAILFDQTQTYSEGLKNSFRESFERLGGRVVNTQAYSGGDHDFSAQLVRIRESAAQAIFIPGYYTDVGNIALQARRLGLTHVLLGGDGWDSPQLAAIAGDAIHGGYFVNHFSADDSRPVVQQFIQHYEARYHERPDALAAQGFDAARLLFAALDRTRSFSGNDVARSIADTKNFSGVTGDITLDAQRNAHTAAVVVQIRNGQTHVVAHIAPK